MVLHRRALFLFLVIAGSHHTVATTSETAPKGVCYDSTPSNGYWSIHKFGTAAHNLCLLNMPPSDECKNWLIVSMIMLQQSGLSNSNLQKVQNFINEITTNCDSNSMMQLYAPGNMQSCPKSYQYGTWDQDQLVNSILPSITYVPSNSSSGEVLVEMLTNMTGCQAAHDEPNPEGRALFIFTDIPCTELCSSTVLHAEVDTLMRTLNQDFIIHVMYMTDDGLHTNVTECLNHVFSYCSGQQTSVCAVNPYEGQYESMSTCAPLMRTCGKNTESKGLTKTELLLATLIPCMCFTVLCVVVAVLCYKKAKKSNRRWMKFWRSQGGSQCEINNFATKSNKYTDIRVIAERNLKDEWEVPLKHLEIKENVILGTGAFSTVFKGVITEKVPLFEVYTSLKISVESQTEAWCETAVKRLPVHADEQSRLDFFHEIDFMKNLGYHSHIISMLGCVSNPWDPLILVEYCHYGDLLKFLRTHRGHVLESPDEDCPIDVEVCLRIKDLVSIAWQISDGMAYLSSKQFIHRDLAARNILLTKNLVAKVADFGLCRYIDSALYSAKGGRLPIKWMALESLKYYEYSMKSDVWSFSILLFELFSLGAGPFQAIQPLDMVEYLEQGHRLKQPKSCPNEIFSLMKKCWQEEPEKRPSFSEVRATLTTFLNFDDENYGYLSIEPSVRKKSEQLTEIEKDCASLTTTSASVVEEFEELETNEDFTSASDELYDSNSEAETVVSERKVQSDQRKNSFEEMNECAREYMEASPIETNASVERWFEKQLTSCPTPR